MAYSDYVVDRVRQRLNGKGVIEEKKMMGGFTFMVNGKMCIGILFDKNKEDKLMVRVGKLNYEELLQLPDSKPMDFTGKPSRDFYVLDPMVLIVKIILIFGSLKQWSSINFLPNKAIVLNGYSKPY